MSEQRWFMMILVALRLLLLLLCGISSSQGQSPALPGDEVKAYNEMARALEKLPPVAYACNENSFSNISITIKCENNVLHQGEMNIISIDMQDSGLNGEFLPLFCKFTHLQELVVASNKIEGSIPGLLGNLSKLTRLDLSSNILGGPIPDSLGALSTLTYLSLSHNLLSGKIPQSFVHLKSLQTLDVSTNKLSGPIPKFLGEMISLKSLNLGSNNFTGSLPPELGTLENLTHLQVPSNNLTGPIPPEYAQLKNINRFSVAGNNMNGSVPVFIKNWILLSRLELMGNDFEGTLPTEIFSLSGLVTLWVSDLNNSGFPFPPSTKFNLKSIKSLILRNCGLNGTIPDYVNVMSKLIHLDLSFNNLTGGIPDTLSELDSLDEMSLAGNKLNESFPDWVLEPGRELLVDLSDNKLALNKTLNTQTLSLANLFGCCSNYTALSDGSSLKNMTSDPYQIMEAHCPKGKPKHNTLHINCGGGEKFEQYEADNATSNVHVSQGKWAYSCSGHFMSTSSGSYSGTYSSANGNYNKKTKCAASPLFETARLCPVSLTYYGFCLHRGEYIVQLHFSEIVYTEEEDYSSLKERLFDVYIQDKLELPDFNIKKKAGAPNRPWNESFRVQVKDDSLLKIQLLWRGKGAVNDDPLLNGPLISAITATPAPKSKKLMPWEIVLIVLASIVFAVLCALAFCWQMGWLENKEWQETRIDLRDGVSITVKQIIDATQNFSKDEIGRGGFGVVYKVGVQDQIVAVKKLSTESSEVVTELRAEIYALKSLEHENLIKFFGSYSRKNLHLLVYEYMKNSSLENALFGSESGLILTWEIRYEICKGIAKGLRYLHEEKAFKIIHRDIKASNILLDENLKAKISDFGLATVYDENKCTEIVHGTHGYMAPEYAMRGIFSDKTDIYSFGILLLEIVSGATNAIDSSSGQRDFLLDRASDLLKRGRLTDLVDKRLKNEYNKKQANNILNLATMCTNISPASRPKISEVVGVLEEKITIKMIAPSFSSIKCTNCGETVILSNDTSMEEGATATSAAQKEISLYAVPQDKSVSI